MFIFPVFLFAFRQSDRFYLTFGKFHLSQDKIIFQGQLKGWEGPPKDYLPFDTFSYSSSLWKLNMKTTDVCIHLASLSASFVQK